MTDPKIYLKYFCFFLQHYSGILYSYQFIKSFRSSHSLWEGKDLSWEINTSFTEWHHYHILSIQFQSHPANSAVAYLKNFYVCFHQFLFITKTFRGSRLFKYLINIELMTFSDKIQAKQSKGIEQAFSCSSCDIHISPFSIILIYTLAFSNVLLVLALNFIVHKLSYCKCSLAWCQVRTFLSFTIWTHPLQMREYPLRYSGTDRNKKNPTIVSLSTSSIKAI